jgi:tRNA (cmo5U34)-methyltransferase
MDINTLEHLKKHWDVRAKDYDSLFEQAPIRQETFDNLKNHLPPNAAKIVDLGAGTGQLTEYLLKDYPNSSFSLVDLSPEMLEIAKQKFMHYSNINYYEASFDQ